MCYWNPDPNKYIDPRAQNDQINAGNHKVEKKKKKSTVQLQIIQHLNEPDVIAASEI